MPKNSTFRSRFWFLGALLILCVIAYGNSLSNGFHEKDKSVIIENQTVTVFNTDNLFRFFTKPNLEFAEDYQPLGQVAFSVLWKVGQGKPWVFHLFKILLHFLVVAFLFQIMLHFIYKSKFAKGPFKLKAALPKREIEFTAEWIAFVACAVFLIHPALTQSLNYISEFVTLQASAFYFLSFWLFIQAMAQENSRNRGTWLFFMTLTFLMSVFSSLIAFSFPLILTIYMVLFRDRSLKFLTWAGRFAVPFGLSVLVISLYLWVRSRVGLPTLPLQNFEMGLVDYLINQLWAWTYYFFWPFIPFGYRLLHSEQVYTSILSVRPILGALFLIGCVWFTIHGLRRRRQYPYLTIVCFGVIWYFVQIITRTLAFPSLQLVDESVLYLPLSFLFVGLSYGFFSFLSRLDFFAIEWSFSGSHQTRKVLTEKSKPTFLSGGIVVVLVALVGLTADQNKVWKTDRTLWENVIRKEPQNGMAYNKLGEIYLREKKLDSALESFEKCSEYWPKHKYCYLNMHLVYLAKDDMEKARAAIYKMNAIDSEFVLGRFQYADFLLHFEKQPEKALEVLQSCDQIAKGKYFPCLNLMIETYKVLDRHAEIVPVARRALKLKSEDRDTKFSLGSSLISIKRWAEAKKVFLEIYEKDTRDIQAIYNIAWLEMKQENWGNSKQRWLETISLDPNIEGAWINLQMVAERLGDRTLVQNCQSELQRLNPKIYSNKKKVRAKKKKRSKRKKKRAVSKKKKAVGKKPSGEKS